MRPSSLDEIKIRVEGLRRRHLEVKDPWFSCPASGTCTRDEPAAHMRVCECGATWANAEIDSILWLLNEAPEPSMSPT